MEQEHRLVPADRILPREVWDRISAQPHACTKEYLGYMQKYPSRSYVVPAEYVKPPPDMDPEDMPCESYIPKRRVGYIWVGSASILACGHMRGQHEFIAYPFGVDVAQVRDQFAKDMDVGETGYWVTLAAEWTEFAKTLSIYKLMHQRVDSVLELLSAIDRNDAVVSNGIETYYSIDKALKIVDHKWNTMCDTYYSRFPQYVRAFNEYKRPDVSNLRVRGVYEDGVFKARTSDSVLEKMLDREFVLRGVTFLRRDGVKCDTIPVPELGRISLAYSGKRAKAEKILRLFINGCVQLYQAEVDMRWQRPITYYLVRISPINYEMFVWPQMSALLIIRARGVNVLAQVPRDIMRMIYREMVFASIAKRA